MEMKTLKTYERILPGDIDTPITLYSKYVQNAMGFLLESKEQPKGRYSFMGTNPELVVKSQDGVISIEDRSGETEKTTGIGLVKVKELMGGYSVENTTSLPFAGGAVGTVGYDMIKEYEAIPKENEDRIGTPDMHLMFVTEYIAYDHHFSQIHIVVLDEKTNEGHHRAVERLDSIQEKLRQPASLDEKHSTSELDFKSNISQADFEAAVEKAKQYIYDGDIFQVVLSQRWSAHCEEEPFMIYRKLRRVNPSPYLFYFNFQDYYIVGSSPEMLVEMRSNKIKNCPIAGTRKRGRTTEEDEMLAADLLADDKERAEHNMLVDLGRNDMGKVSKIGSVEVTQYMQVEKYSHVMHIVSLVEGEKSEKDDMFDVLMSFLPAGTLSGAPKIRAMEIIEELETVKRGIYGGAIGYFGFNRNMDMCIAIRTMVIKDQTVHIQAGAGIVADSVPSMEFAETENKARALMTAIRS